MGPTETYRCPSSTVLHRVRKAIGAQSLGCEESTDIGKQARRRREQRSDQNGIIDLPLVEVPAERATNDAFAVIYSGDGGWRDLDRTLADVLAAKGMNVVGVDVLRYYWKSKSPDVAARDLTRIIRYYQLHWQRQKVLLIGFSFGADVLPFLIDRLPADERGDVNLVSLLSPERTTAFEVQPGGWLGRQSASGIPIEPALRPLSVIHIQCIYGGDEADTSLCTTPTAAAHEVVRKSGGHHFDENYDQLANDILAAARSQP
jgi:type IV secretory pathway VirJ component